jgi:hypothetical protein
MVRFRHRRVLTLVALVPTLVFLSPLSSAQAAVPVAGISYTGSSAHGLYTLAITTSCVANDTTLSAICATPSFLDVTVTPTAKIGTKCDPYGGLAMGYIPLKASGAFTVKDYSADNYNVSVTGQFTSPRSMKGTIDNVGFGCPSDTFDISIAPPVSPLSPCEILAKVHAVRVIAAGRPATITENDFTAANGQCSLSVARVSDLDLVVSSSRASLPVGIGGMTAKSLAGPGVGAMLYSAATGNFFQAIVIFHHGSSWAALNYDYQHSPCPSSTPVGTSCVTKGSQSSITAHVEASARQVYPLL